jgi:hypothetical protein
VVEVGSFCFSFFWSQGLAMELLLVSEKSNRKKGTAEERLKVTQFLG